MPIQDFLNTEENVPLNDEINQEPNANSTLNWSNVILIIYLVGFLFFILRFLYLYVKVFFLIRTGKKIYECEATIVIHNKEIAPFSWMNYIVVAQNDYDETQNSILIHELAHVREGHSFDLLILNILALFQWYNPVMWLMKKELQDIHEFEADNIVINSGIDAKQYQLLLIQRTAGTMYSRLVTNSFNHSNVKIK